MSTDGLLVHKAIVHTSDPVTGICTVRIPALMGGQVVTVGHDGLIKTAGVWNVPPVGTQVSVSSTKDMRMFSWIVTIPGQATVITVDTAVGAAFAALLANPDPFPQYATDTDVGTVTTNVSALSAAVTALQNKLVPAGTIHATVGATADVGYFLIDGSTVVSAQTLYPAMWARIPGSWKSGANMVMPDWRNRMLVMDDAGGTLTLGGAAGSMTKTIATANVPVHSHAIDHTHNTATSGGQSNNHSHDVTGNTGTESASHYHTADAGSGIVQALASPGVALGNGGTTVLYVQWGSVNTGNQIGAHVHAMSFTSGAANADHTHTVAVPGYTGSSGNTGSGTPLDITPAVGVVNFQIKAH